MISRRRFVQTVAGAAGFLSLRDSFWHAEAQTPADPPGTVVLFRRNEAGETVLRHVRGESPYPDGSYVTRDIPTGLPKHAGADQRQITQPSATQHPRTGRTHVARATFNTASGRTSIHTISSTHPSMLSESIPTSFERPVIIDSAVVLTHFNNLLLLVWQERAILKCCESADGSSWSAVRDLAPVAAGERFALWSEDDKLYLAATSNGGTALAVRESKDARTWTTQFPVAGLPSCMSSNPFCLTGPITALALATTANHVFVAFGESGRLKLVRFRKGPVGFNLRSLIVSVARQLTNPNPALHDVALHPSQYGWTLVFVESFADPASPTGRTFNTGGLRSSDGLDYTGVEWAYVRSSQNTGGASLVMTEVPMPWIVKTHDSGRPPDTVYNFVITADGFTYSDKDRLYQMCKEMTGNVVNRAPFFYNQNLFNFWAVLTYSKDAGWADPTSTPPVETIFGARRDPATNMAIVLYDGMKHARLLLTGNRDSANYYGWTLYSRTVGVTPWDSSGVPLSEPHLHSIAGIHEYMHTDTGRFDLGDHDLRYNRIKISNKTFDGNFRPTGNHAWQDWFVFSSPTASRKIPVTDAYRNGLKAWVAAGNTPRSYWAFPYSTDPASPSYVDALSLFQVGLWESELADVADLAADPLYTAMRACMMNSQIHHSAAFCPICSRVIVEQLHKSSGMAFTLSGFRSAPMAFLEFQSRNARICGATSTPAPLDLAGLVVINGHPIAASDFSTYQADTLEPIYVSRTDLTRWVTAGSPATLEFKQRSSGETRIWIPGIQVLNSKGARYSMQPVPVNLPSGATLVDRLHDKHLTSQTANASGCDYEYWDLSEGHLVLSFTPQ